MLPNKHSSYTKSLVLIVAAKQCWIFKSHMEAANYTAGDGNQCISVNKFSKYGSSLFTLVI